MCRVRIGIIATLFKGRNIAVFAALAVYSVAVGGACRAALRSSRLLLSGRTLSRALLLCVCALRAWILSICALCRACSTRCGVLRTGGSARKSGVTSGDKLRLRLLCSETVLMR